MKISSEDMALRREEMLEAAFHLFTERNIDAVTQADIAKKTGYTTRSLQRYFHGKDELVVAVSTWAMESFAKVNSRYSPGESGTAAEFYTFFVDSFLRLYREHRDILRFNQFFNVYTQSRRVSLEQMRPYTEMIDGIRAWFHKVWLQGRQDGTLRTDVPEDEMFSTTLHLMLAAVTRYAVGLVYDLGVNPEQELLTQREMLLARYTVTPERRSAALKRSTDPCDLRGETKWTQFTL